MKRKSNNYGKLVGNLEIFSAKENGKKTVFIHGDSKGLKSFADLIIALSKVDQESFKTMQEGWREHVHLHPDLNLSRSSDEIIVGRLDGKGNGKFPKRYKKRKRNVVLIK